MNGSDDRSMQPPADDFILLADDSESVRAALSTILRSAGHEVVCVNNGFDALARLRTSRPALAVLDAQMPVLDGARTCALIRRNEHFDDMPIIMLSANAGVSARALASMSGCDDFLPKSADGLQLLACVKRQLPAKTQRDEAAGVNGEGVEKAPMQ